jgi:hypothetical protein
MVRSPYAPVPRRGYPQRGLGAPGGPQQGPRSRARRERYAPLWITHGTVDHARPIRWRCCGREQAGPRSHTPGTSTVPARALTSSRPGPPIRIAPHRRCPPAREHHQPFSVPRKRGNQQPTQERKEDRDNKNPYAHARHFRGGHAREKRGSLTCENRQLKIL